MQTATELKTLEELHAVQLKALCEIKRVCKKHNIRWFLHGGTMLGALRHNGPIPWDDDIDIAMLQEDFERFKRVALPEMDKRFVFTDHSNDEEFFDFVPRITDTAYTYRLTSNYTDRFNEAFGHPDMDIFVFVPACSGKRDVIQSLRLTMNYAKALGHRRAVDHSQFKGMAKVASYILPALGRKKSIAQLLEQRANLAKWGSEQSDNLRIVNDLPAYMDRRYQKTWYNMPQQGERMIFFSGELMPVPQDAEEEMNVVYGANWHELPPASARKPAHAAFAYNE